MIKGLWRAMTILAVVWLAACGPFRPRPPEVGPEVAAAAEAAESLRAELRTVGRFPSVEDMRPDVTLYTEVVWLQDAREESRRDTLRTPVTVASWLENRRSRQSSDVLFELETDEVYQCDEAVLQYGTYPVVLDGLGRRTYLGERVLVRRELARYRFVARWLRGADGTLELGTLWMSPIGGEARVGRLGEGCRSVGAAKFAALYAVRRAGVDVSAGATYQAPTTESLEQAFVAQEWDQDMHSATPLTVSAEGFYRFRPGWQVAGLAGYQLPGSVDGFAGRFRARVEWTGLTAGGLLAREVGPLRVGAGPAVAITRWEWSDEMISATFEPGEPTSGTTVTPGALAELSLVHSPRSRLYVRAAARYYLFGDAEVPGFRDLGPVDVARSQAQLTLGAGWWW
ncbi:MAG: hypothetical protein R6U63_01250 [Longimicrobiales bacterium]